MCKAEGSTGALYWSGVAGPAGVIEQGTRTRAPQEPGRPGRLHPEAPAGNRHIPTPGPRAPRLRARERIKAQGSGTAKRRKRSAAGRAAGSRSASWYLRCGGTLPEGTPRREGGAGTRATPAGKMMETSGSAIVSTPRCARPFGKLRRIAELAREMPGPKVGLVRRFGLP